MTKLTNERLHEHLKETRQRLRKRDLFGAAGDSLSVRVPGRNAFILAKAATQAIQTIATADADSESERLHAAIYRTRPDIGAVLIGTSEWSTALLYLGGTLPALFDEQARHLGDGAPSVRAGDWSALEEGIRPGGNALTFGSQRVVLGATPNRVVLNADLFEKCAKAFVIASSATATVRSLPRWARRIWVRRLRADQARAARAYQDGRIPEGMDAY
jgi:ribulose-5-phosphate 4-epimerase/fuculose-1-phosphate aldolase